MFYEPFMDQHDPAMQWKHDNFVSKESKHFHKVMGYGLCLGA
jgi:hypothetical protein